MARSRTNLEGAEGAVETHESMMLWMLMLSIVILDLFDSPQ